MRSVAPRRDRVERLDGAAGAKNEGVRKIQDILLVYTANTLSNKNRYLSYTFLCSHLFKITDFGAEGMYAL